MTKISPKSWFNQAANLPKYYFFLNHARPNSEDFDRLGLLIQEYEQNCFDVIATLPPYKSQEEYRPKLFLGITRKVASHWEAIIVGVRLGLIKIEDMQLNEKYNSPHDAIDAIYRHVLSERGTIYAYFNYYFSPLEQLAGCDDL